MVENMIPKVIHYCWFGRGEKNELAKKCIESWKKYCPDYKFKEWNEDNFDINSNQYVKEAYENKKWAFVTDYVRLYALYNEGGVYMDTDVEIIKSIDAFLVNHAFSSFESINKIPTGLMASEKYNVWIKDLLREYDELHFVKDDGSFDLTPNGERITNLSKKEYGLIRNNKLQYLKNNSVVIYPLDYFCAKDTKTGVVTITDNTYSIHHFSGSWLPDNYKLKRNLRDECVKKYGPKFGIAVMRIKYYWKRPKQLIESIRKKLRNKYKGK